MESLNGVNAITIVFAALCIFAIAYRFYGLWVAQKVLNINAARETPANRFEDGKDYVPTNKYVLFGHHFAAIAAAGPLLGPVLAAQFGYLPGLLWILIGCVLAGGVHDMVVLFCSVRHRGKSLAYIASQEIDTTTGRVAAWAVLAILLLTLAGLSIAVVNAMHNSLWSTYTVFCTIPIAVLMGLYMQVWRKGDVRGATIMGVVLLFLCILSGPWVASHPEYFGWLDIDKPEMSLIIPAYGFLASVLPVWLLLLPRDYLSTFLKIGTIGALAIGVSIFNFIYWNCSFVRMGTSGLTAQAFGAGNFRECTNMLVRAMVVAAGMGLLMLALQYPLGELALWGLNGNEMTREYFYARIWAVPAGILLFGFNGWFTGMQNAMIPMFTAISVNAVHVLCSLWFAFGMDMGIVGIAYASVIAQWTGVGLSLLLLMLRYRKVLTGIDWAEVFDMKPLKTFFIVNRDIMLRTLCIVAVYTFFTGASARMEDPVLLAVNTLLLQLFTLFSYMNDGFAYAAEALTGRFIGARDVKALRDCLRRCIAWGTAVSVLFVGIYIVWWRDLVGLFIDDSAANAATIVEVAGRYIVWIILIPVASAMPFIMDGIMVGATQTRVMRNSMFWATAAYFGIFYIGHTLIGNNALWLAFTLYMFLRGVLQYFMTHSLRTIYRKAGA